MSFALVGPGAIGSTIAALLYAAGREVLLCGRTPRGAIEVRVDGSAPIVVPGPVHTDPDTVAGPVDVVLLAVKDTQYAASAPWLARLCGPDTVVCALQNGVDVKTVSSMLGHYSAGFTLDTYAHVTTDAQLKAAQTMGSFMAQVM